MRRALRGTSIRGHGSLPAPVFQVQNIPPPVGGLNKRDAVPLMAPTDAVVLDNWIPDTNHVRVRGGYDLHSDIAAANHPVETLIPYHSPTIGAGQLFAVARQTIDDAGTFYEVTDAGQTDEVATMGAFDNARFQYDHLTNTAGSFVVVCNGVDTPRTYDGTTWSNLSLNTASASASTTTFAAEGIVNIRNHMNRLWFVFENSLIPYYMVEPNAIGGTVEPFMVPFRKGGRLEAIGSWTVDGGAGSDDLIVFLNSRGEAVIYGGSDPSSISTWGLQGRYEIPNVIGRRCLVNAGSDLGIITVQGLVPLSQVIRGTVGAAQRVAFTDKISGYFRERFPQSGNLFGWQAIEYPRGNLVIINVPLREQTDEADGDHQQVVSNINTGSWCRWTGINAACWTVFNDELYFGSGLGDGRVYRYDMNLRTDGDDEDDIVAVMQTAYSTFGTPLTKRIVDARPLFLAGIGYDPDITIQVDYDVTRPTTTLALIPGGTQWGDGTGEEPENFGAPPQWTPELPSPGDFDIGADYQWAGGTAPVVRWDGAAGVGHAVSVAFSVSTASELIYNGCDVGFELGNYL